MDEFLGFLPSDSVAFTVIVAFLVIVLVLKAVRTVPQGFEWTVERFGRYSRTLRPGLNFMVPLWENVGHKINMMEQVLDIPSQEVITADNAQVTADGVVFYQIVDAAKAAYEVSDLQRAMQNLSMPQLRTVMGSMDLDKVLSERDEINSKIMRVIDEATNPWGVKVTRFEIKDISPPQDLVDAMARQMKAEREKRAEILEAEGAKQSAILRAEGLKQAAILEAEGKKEAAFRDAEATERRGVAEGKAATSVADAIKGDTSAVNYFLGQRYVDALARFADSDQRQTVFLPLDATGVMGALAGVSELTKSLGGGAKS